MARTDSWMGLSPRGREIVAGRTPRTYREHHGLCNTFALDAYRLADGREVFEEVQTDIWASGPYWFLCLKDEAGQEIAESVWSDQELADAMGFEVGEAQPSISEADVDLFTRYESWIDSGGMTLHWADEAKYKRWKAAKHS